MTKKNTPPIKIKPGGDQYIVVFTIGAGISRTRLYREITRVSAEMNFERIGSSAYLVNSDCAQDRAHALAEMAARFGAGKVGEAGGPSIWKLTEQTPDEYFAHRQVAEKVVDELLVDHRVKTNKRRSRSIATIVAELGLGDGIGKHFPMQGDGDKIIDLQKLFDADARAKKAR